MHQKVVWKEGMLLQPQHFQQQYRHFSYLIKQTHSLLSQYNWGFSQLTINYELLAVGKFSLSSCKAIFADGTHYDAPTLDKLPNTINIPTTCKNELIYLALPLVNDQNIQRDTTQSIEIADNTLNAQQTNTIELAKLYPKLTIGDNNLGAYVYQAVAKINSVESNKLVKLCNNFIPPCLTINCNNQLKKLTTELYELLQYRAQQLALQLNHKEHSIETQIITTTLLQLINRAIPFFNHLHQNATLHPEQFYLHIACLLAELSTFTTKKHFNTCSVNYLHHDLATTLTPLCNQLRKALNQPLEQQAITIKLNLQAHGIWLTDKNQSNIT